MHSRDNNLGSNTGSNDNTQLSIGLKDRMVFREDRLNKGLKDKLMFYTVRYDGEERVFRSARAMFDRMKEIRSHGQAWIQFVFYTEHSLYLALYNFRCITTDNCIADDFRYEISF